jgi:hypothetical protein
MVPSSSGRIVNNTQAEEKGMTRGGEPPVININNVLDPKLAGDYLNTPEGEKVILNVLSRNKSQLFGLL